ncbi:MAG: cupin domain-containing protein, partial [Rhodobacteraceae bacterium]|nr:cupin domain-containing protein [Paracoccaceae bacterium]
SGEAQMWSGERMEHHVVVRAGDMLYIPAGVPHLPVNLTDAPVTAVIARTDPNEQESVELRPDLEALVPG